METELKFQVPPAQRAAVLKAVATAGATTTRLQAVYADTADQRLAAAGLALRLRKEGRRWVQTLKGRAEGPGGLMQRLEHEVPVPGTAEPALDPGRHAGTPVGERLLALLADGAVLAPVYRTDVRRVHRVTTHAGARIELAYDRGRIVAGERVLPVDELELELLRGPAAALPSLAGRWVQRFGLWWDIRTKSERGFRLARGEDTAAAVHATQPALQATATPAQAFTAATASALQQVLANACEIASETGTPEHLHQLRVGLRRLRSLLRVLGAWSADPAIAAQLEADWREPFGQLGASRDGDVLAAEWLPQLQAAGAPELALPPVADAPAVQQLLRSPAFNTLLLRSLVFITAEAPSCSPEPLPKATQAAVAPLLKQARRAAGRFDAASTEERHRLRKRLKRLRYVLDALQPLLRRKAGARLSKALRRVLRSLGTLNDLATAEAAFRGAAAAQPTLWFAAGWLRARHDALLPQVHRELQLLSRAPSPWR